jgi:chemotaxis signal transduction protein
VIGAGTFDVLFFELGGRRCALATAVVREVARMPTVTPVPLAGPMLAGAVPLRGQVLPLLDLRDALTAGPTGDPSHLGVGPRTDEDTVVVVEAPFPGETATVRAALVVDRVLRVAAVDDVHGRTSTAGPSWISAAITSGEGPALLIDVSQALAAVRESLLQEGSR